MSSLESTRIERPVSISTMALTSSSSGSSGASSAEAPTAALSSACKASRAASETRTSGKARPPRSTVAPWPPQADRFSATSIRLARKLVAWSARLDSEIFIAENTYSYRYP